MALRHHTGENNIANQENLTVRLKGKEAGGRGLVPPKRLALNEVGNKLNNDTIKNNAMCKAVGTMQPPIVVLKKPATAGLKKENTTKKLTLTKPAPMIRQESILKKAEVKPFKDISSKQITIIDPDASSHNDPQMVTEYLGEIFEYLRELEVRWPIEENYLEDHKTTPKMRMILINWLVEVQMNFKMCLETLHLCISIIDRYLQINKHVGRETLQLVGTSAMLIACKYEEMYLPELDDFVFICDDTFTKRQILQMEQEILAKLDFSLGRPLSVHFLRRYSKVAKVQSEHHTLSKYLLELALMDYSMCHIRPSIQAAAACCLSMAILNNIEEPNKVSKVWTPTLVYYSTYEFSEFKSVVKKLANLLVNVENIKKFKIITNKYASASNGKISLNYKLTGPLVMKLTSINK